MRTRKFFALLGLLAQLSAASVAENKIWAYPYLQNATPTSIDVYWVSEDPRPVLLHLGERTKASVATPAPALTFNALEAQQFPELARAAPRFVHRVELTGLEPAETYDYRVSLSGGSRPFSASFTTQPNGRRPYRFVAYADSETEPESLGLASAWPSPEDPDRVYLVDQVTGYAANLQTILERKPHAILIAGDLVESGGEQRDWDEFWRMNTGPVGAVSVASQIPILPAIGNHEYWGGPETGRYSLPAILSSSRRYFTYFHPTGPEGQPNYYSTRLGPARLISLDSCDGTPHGTPTDPNYFMSAAPNEVPGIGPDSRQYQWLESELAEAQKEDSFTFVFFHHCPYSSGPHGLPPGTKAGQDPQSGQPLRVWTPLFLRYGVDAVINGHDEMWERSEVHGTELTPTSDERPHAIHYYDVGVGGDGLRRASTENPQRRFLAETGAPEQWENGSLIEGGRHYGHLEVNLEPEGERGWRATLDPVYVFPVRDGSDWRFERRLYSDQIVLRSRP